MSKIKTTIKVSLKFTSRINLGVEGAHTEPEILNTARNPPPSPPKKIPTARKAPKNLEGTPLRNPFH